MIDLHTHILPGIDDGSKNVEESIALLKMLEEQGVDKVVLTPHYYGRNCNVRQFLASREIAYRQLATAYKGPIRLYSGCECNIATCANSDFSELIPLAINGGKYILTELSFDRRWGEKLWNRITMLTDQGLRPVIAHAELYPEIQRHPQAAERLIDCGCLIQVNCDSLLDKRLFRIVKRLIDNNQVHCIGTDTHNQKQRMPRYSSALKIMMQFEGNCLIRKVQSIMNNIIDNDCSFDC